MATKKKPQVTDNKNSEVDDLLDGPGSTNGTDEAPQTDETGEASQVEDEPRDIDYDGKLWTKSELEAELKSQQEKAKTLKALVKGEKAPITRTAKGILVAFKNKAGETIIGPGVLYYVARHKGKLHYKEASMVTILPDNWKEGDPIEFKEKPVAEETTAPEGTTVPEGENVTA